MINKFFAVFILTLILLLPSCSDFEKMRNKKVFQAIQDKDYNYISDSDHYDVKDKYKRTPLMLAIINDDIKMVKLLIKKGAKIESKDVFGETPLQKATTNGKFEISKFLIENKANINHFNKYSWSILMKAVYSENLDLIKYLIEHGANIDFYRPKNKVNSLLLASGGNQYTWMKNGSKFKRGSFRRISYNGFKASAIKTDYNELNENYGILRFSFRNKLSIMKFLIKSGADINYSDKYGNTALINSIKSENLESIQWLISNGADINLISKGSKRNKTALIEAVKLGNIDIVKLLIKNKASTIICDENDYSPYIYSLIKKRNNITSVLKKMPHRCSKGWSTQLSSLLDSSKYNVLKQIDIKNDFKENEIIEGIIISLKKKPIKYLKLLIKNIDPLKANKILKYALDFGSTRDIDLVIKNNFTIKEEDLNPLYSYKIKKITLEELKKMELPKFINEVEKITPLMLASKWNDLDLVKFIISKDKNTINILDNNGLNAIFYSVKNGDNKVNDFLLKNGISVKTLTNKKESLAMFALQYKAKSLAKNLIKNNYDKNLLSLRTSSKWDLVKYASRYNSYDSLTYLFKKGVNYSFSYRYNIYSPLISAIRSSSSEIVSLLIKKGAKPYEYYDEQSPLMHAVEKNKYKTTKILLKNKCFLFREDNKLWNTLIYSARYSNLKLFKLILKNTKYHKDPKTGQNSNLFLIASIKKDNVEILKEIKKLKIVDVNAKNIIGETALIVAVKNNNIKNIKYLLSIGANPSIKDINGLNSYHFAKTRGYQKALKELNKYNIIISNK